MLSALSASMLVDFFYTKMHVCACARLRVPEWLLIMRVLDIIQPFKFLHDVILIAVVKLQTNLLGELIDLSLQQSL